MRTHIAKSFTVNVIVDMVIFIFISLVYAEECVFCQELVYL